MAAATLLSPTGAVVIQAAFPKKLAFLLEQRARFKVLYGGRGASRSWSIVRALLIRGIKEPGLRVLCAREVQSSMRESVHQLIRDQIDLMGLKSFYRVLDSEIRGPGGTLFLFKGLSDPEALKSMEAIDVLFLEEARTVTKTSWEKVIPTIRKENSEIWIAYNPELEQDFIHQLFVVKDPPPNSIVVKVNWRDNPWFPEVLRSELEHMKATNYDDYLWVWEGHCRTSLDGAVFADELRALRAEDRICPVPYISGRPVQTFHDLGYADHTSIWFAQVIGFRYHFIDYYENNRKLQDHYIQVLQNRGYTYGPHWLPEDANAHTPGVRRTVKEQMQDAGMTVKIVPKLRIPLQVGAARTIFPVCVFDAERCEQGLARLRAWRYELNEVKGKWSRDPIHDEASHAGSAFCSAGAALKGDTAAPKTAKPRELGRRTGGGQSWMGN